METGTADWHRPNLRQDASNSKYPQD